MHDIHENMRKMYMQRICIQNNAYSFKNHKKTLENVDMTGFLIYMPKIAFDRDNVYLCTIMQTFFYILSNISDCNITVIFEKLKTLI